MSSRVDRVYRYGCWAPESREETKTALQLLGQAWLYREELRRAYNRQKRFVRELRRERREVGDESAHVEAFAYDDLKAQIRRLRSERGHLLDAGTYWLLEKAALQASKDSGLDPVKLLPFDGTGRIGAMIMSSEQMNLDDEGSYDLLFRHKRVTLTRPDERGFSLLTLKVGDLKEDRSLSWSVKMHRPLPAGAIVKQVAMQRFRKHGHRFRWALLVTVSFEDDLRETRDAGARGVVGLNLGWRSDEDLGMRVATWNAADDAGVLRIDTHEAFEYADAVRGVRDLTFDQAKAYVKAQGVPGTEHTHLWKDKDRMRRLAARTDDLGAVWWEARDKHLEDIECGNRTRAVRRRSDAYRVFADRLARRYRTVALDDMPMEDWVGEAETSSLERRRSIGNLSELQTTIALRFGPERVDWVPTRDASRTCSACGEVRETGVGPKPFWTCGGCGAVHHQDENAAIVYRRRCERWIAAENLPRARARKPKRRKEIRRGDGIATGDTEQMSVTPREASSEAAE